MTTHTRGRGTYRGKRALDVGLALPLFALTLPVQLAAAAAVRLRLGSPVLFRQTRPGRDAEPFEMVKLRTMLHPDPASGRLDDAARLTRLGMFLRATSIDELPALWHVLTGRMSLVGPRPLLMQYLPLYTDEQARRHQARPGLTGLAQVSGRNGLAWEERFALDVAYVDSLSLRLDLRILHETVRRVWRRDGVSAEGHVTVEPFAGSVTCA